MTLVERIKDLCRKQGIPVARLEELAELKPRTIGKWDENKPSVDKVQRVARCLHVSIDYLLGDDNYDLSDSDEDDLKDFLEDLRTRPEMRMLMKTQRGATKEEVQENIRFLEALKNVRGSY